MCTLSLSDDLLLINHRALVSHCQTISFLPVILWSLWAYDSKGLQT